MNRHFAVISVIAGWVSISAVPCAQGTVFVSNLDLPSSGSLAVAADSWLAAEFRTGSDPYGYSLNSVHLSIAPASGAASGFAASLYTSDSSSDPGSFLGSLTGPDPASGGLFVYTAAGIRLDPESNYFLVMTAESFITDGIYEWNLANSPHGYDTVDGWIIGAGHHYSGDGTDWSFSRAFPLQFAVDATAVPEPSTILLVVLGFSALVGGRAFRSSRGGQ